MTKVIILIGNHMQTLRAKEVIDQRFLNPNISNT